jgi:isopenicillin-N epimerase
LSIPAAIEFLRASGLEEFRTQTHALVQSARRQILEIPGTAPLTPDDPAWYGSMATIRIPAPDQAAFPGEMHPLQKWLWEEHRIEIPIIRWRERTHVRVSCHLYNGAEQIERLVFALKDWLARNAAL